MHVLLVELLELHLIFIGLVRVWWESHLCLVKLIKHHGGLYSAHLRHFETSLIDSFLVDPRAVWVLHIGSLIELCGLLASASWHATKLLTT